MKLKSLKINILYSSVRTLMGFVFPLISFPYASRILRPEGMGKTNFANSIMQYFILIAGLGVTSYGIKQVAMKRENKKELSQFCVEIFILNLISTIFSYLVFVVLLFCVPKFTDYKSLLIIYSLLIIFTTLGLDWVYTGLEEFKYITYRSFFFQLCSLLMLFIFVKNENDYLKYAAINVFSIVGANLCNFFHCRKFISLREVANINIKQHLKPIFIYFSLALIVNIYTVLDTVMLGFFCGDFEVGIYSVSTKINKMVLGVLCSILAVLVPRVQFYFGKNDKENFFGLFYKAFQIVFILGIPATIGLSILSEPVIILFSGNEYMSAIPVMRIMNPIIVIISTGVCIGTLFFVSVGKEKYIVIADSIGAGTNFILNLFLIPKYGAKGAGIATVIAELCVTCSYFIQGHNLFEIKKCFKNLWQYLCASLVMAVFVFIISNKLGNSIYSCICCILIACVIYFPLLLLFKNSLLIDFLFKKKEKNKK